jgi:hypothetical protein
MLGLYNPLALPIEMEWQPPRAIGRATFDTPYEGRPAACTARCSRPRSTR